MKNKRFRKTLSAVLSAALMLQSGIVGAAEEQSETIQVMSVNEDEAAAQSEAARIAAEQAAQSEAESEAARIAAEQAAQSEAESEAARIAAEQAAQSEAESEAARLAAEQAAQSEAESEAARIAAEQAAQSEAESEAARLAAEQAAQSEAESEAARLAAEQAAQSEAESEAARLAAEQAAQSEKQTEAQTSKEDETEASSAETKDAKKKKKEKETERSGYENAGEKMSAQDAASGLRYASLYLFAAQSVTADEALLEGMAVAVEEEGTAIVKELEAFSLEMADAKSSSDLEVINLYADEDGKLDEAQLEALAEDKVIDVSSKYILVNIIADEAEQDLDFAGYDMILSDVPVEYVSGEQPCDIIYNFAAWDDGEFVGYEGTVTLANDDGLQGIFIAPEAEMKVNFDLAGSVYAKKITVDENVEELLKLTFAQSTAAAETEAVTEKQSESVTETVTEATSEVVIEAVTEAESEVETEAVSEVVIEAVTEAAGEVETETVTEAASEVVTETVTEAASEAETETVTEAASEAETEAVTEAASEVVIEAVTEAASETATENETATEVLDEVLLDEELIVENYASELFETEETQTETNAVMPADIAESAVITVVAEDETTALDGAVFVIRDKEGNVVSTATADGLLQESISYDGVPVTLYGLADGEYVLSQIGASTGKFNDDGTVTEGEYQIAEDTAFQISAAEGAAVVSLLIVNRTVPSDGKKLTVSAQSYYSTTAENTDTKTNVLLTAEADKSYYFAVFTKDTAGVKRISAVQQLTILSGQTDSSAAVQTDQSTADGSTAVQPDQSAATQSEYAKAVLSGLSDGTYYLAATDAFGNLLNPENISYRLQETDTAAKMTMTPVVIGEQDTEKTAVLQFVYQNGKYPEAEFSYVADVNLTVNVLGKDGKALAVSETFYASIYSDESLTTAVTEAPIEINLDNVSSASAVYQLKMTAAEGTYYVAEVNADGTLITPESGFAYAVTYPGNETGAFTVNCGQTSQVGIQNKLNDSIVKIGVTNASNGNYLSGAVLAIKNSSGRVIAVSNAKTFESKAQAIELTNLLEDGSQYYLSEIQAPEGYTPSPDVKFTVKKGQTTEVVISNTPTVSTDYQLTVSKQVYFDDKQVYGYDTTNKTYAKAGAYTFYAALFSDAKHTKKVSDVQKITVSGFNGTTTFKNLESGKTYYLAETTQYGEVYKSSTTTRTIKYTNSGKITISKKSQSAIIQNAYVYEKLSDTMKKAYRYTGTLTITKQVVDTSGAALAVNGTFYAGIYRKADYSDKPTIVKLELKNASSASVKRRILLSSGSDMTYYIAELDASGNRITDESEFSYAVSLDKTEAVVSKGADTAVTITNKVKSSKATLYITKKVYEGTTLKKVNETFYAGLFKDAEFKELYTNPVPLKLENKSELTLKLSLNLGKASKATIYIAEVDKDGNVIKNQRDFGYEVKIINSTAAFTQDKLEIQTVLVNSVYGSASTSDWDDIYQNEVDSSSDGSYSSYGDLDGGTFSSNGDSSGTVSGVATGDNTPIAWYVILLGASMAVFAGAMYRRRRGVK